MQTPSILFNQEFKALADKSRLEIFWFIHEHNLKCTLDENGNKDCAKQCCIKDIAKYFDLSLSTVSYHIKELTNNDLIQITKKGRWSYCQVNKAKIQLLINFFNTFL